MRNAIYPSITDLIHYSDCGWVWAVTNDYEGGQEYRTNKSGYGLWRIAEGKDEQVEGTWQFGLPKQGAAAYQKIRRYFTEYMEEEP